jgi:hypothetical protein
VEPRQERVTLRGPAALVVVCAAARIAAAITVVVVFVGEPALQRVLVLLAVTEVAEALERGNEDGDAHAHGLDRPELVHKTGLEQRAQRAQGLDGHPAESRTERSTEKQNRAKGATERPSSSSRPVPATIAVHRPARWCIAGAGGSGPSPPLASASGCTQGAVERERASIAAATRQVSARGSPPRPSIASTSASPSSRTDRAESAASSAVAKSPAAIVYTVLPSVLQLW